MLGYCYIAPDGTLMAVPMAASNQTIDPGRPVALFPTGCLVRAACPPSPLLFRFLLFLLHRSAFTHHSHELVGAGEPTIAI
jgi:hypothetical protein